MNFDYASIMRQFTVPGAFRSAAPYGTGHINDTYCVECVAAGRLVRYILQRVNHRIFAAPDRLMQNIVRVTGHVRAKLATASPANIERGTLTVVPARDGKAYHRDEAGNWWRVYVFIEGARTYDVVQNRSQAFAAARAFGAFPALLSDFPAATLHETIPAFHHTPSRLARLKEAIGADAHNRAAGAGAEIAFVLAREEMTTRLTTLAGRGELCVRVTHNDTKINNVMIDDATGDGVCVIDLDTVMPGLSLYDFGDCVRTTTALAAEDERDLARVGMSLDLFAALADGYLSSARALLSPLEADLLPFSGMLITLEIGIRFLTDYLEGDVYFKTHRPGQNLDRARTQFAMVASMERQMAQMEMIVARLR